MSRDTELYQLLATNLLNDPNDTPITRETRILDVMSQIDKEAKNACDSEKPQLLASIVEMVFSNDDGSLCAGATNECRIAANIRQPIDSTLAARNQDRNVLVNLAMWLNIHLIRHKLEINDAKQPLANPAAHLLLKSMVKQAGNTRAALKQLNATLFSGKTAYTLAIVAKEATDAGENPAIAQTYAKVLESLGVTPDDEAPYVQTLSEQEHLKPSESFAHTSKTTLTQALEKTASPQQIRAIEALRALQPNQQAALLASQSITSTSTSRSRRDKSVNITCGGPAGPNHRGRGCTIL